MEVKIRETGEIKTLSIYDGNGINWIKDFIGNTGALSDGQFEWDGEEEVYFADQETYTWWRDVIRSYNEAEEAMEEYLDSIEDENERENARRYIDDACCVDFGDVPSAIMGAIEDLKEKGKN